MLGQMMTIDEAERGLARFECSVRVQKLSRSTLISDCDKNLWILLGMTYEDTHRIGGRPQIGDLPFDVWFCEIGRKPRTVLAWATSMRGAISAALAKT